MSGFRLSLIVGGAVLLVASLVANRFIPGRGLVHLPEVEAGAGERQVEPAPALEF
jgi:hypothetical protein